jgi:putative molybdopterin biosynthesis protein
MKKITIRPAWTFTSENGNRVDPQLFGLLRAIHDTGKLTLAVGQVKLSYRYAWDLLAKWSQFFGNPLVKMERGKGAQLTPLGAKLLWAEQRTDASLFPQLENIASELNLEISRALKDSQSVIRIHASHGYAVEKLPALMRQHGHASVDLQYMGSVAALASLCRSNCDLAGFHMPLGELGATLWEHYAKWIKPRQQRIIRLVIRTQGLIVPKGNPRKIASLADLTQPSIRFVNRQRDSGTRILLDGLLSSHSVDPRSIQGYESGEFTHAAVAAFVASGMADVGFGIEPAARQFRLDFVPIMKERYMLACRTNSLRQAPIQELVALLKGPEFLAVIAPVPGYSPDSPGEVVPIKDVFPWSGG